MSLRFSVESKKFGSCLSREAHVPPIYMKVTTVHYSGSQWGNTTPETFRIFVGALLVVTMIKGVMVALKGQKPEDLDITTSYGSVLFYKKSCIT